jgi:hypothetical protein
MTRFRQGLSVLGVGLIVSGWCWAQAASSAKATEADIEQQLLSGNPRLVAWGAHGAVVAHSQALNADLLALASRWQPLGQEASTDSESAQLSPEQQDQRDAMAEVLDALIQINASVPADILPGLAPDFGNDVAILLSRMSRDEVESVSYDFYRSPAEHGYGLQYVSAALLARHPVPGFAADLLTSISVHATILAVAPGSGGFGGGRCAGACFTSLEIPRKDWPAIGQYTLHGQTAAAGAFQLVGGVNPVYAARREAAHYLGDGCGGVYLGAAERLRLIAEMLNIAPEAMPWKTELMDSIEFQSLEQFHRAVLAFVGKQQQKYRETVAAMADHGLLTSAEAAESLPNLQLYLDDRREEGSAPMPDPGNLPGHVEWTSGPI